MGKDINGHSSLDGRIDEIRMCQSDRLVAKAQIHKADAAAEIFCRAIGTLRDGGHALAHLIVAKASRLRSGKTHLT